MNASVKIIGDWKKEIGVSLHDALAVSMDVIGRTGEEACRHALILMAQSARALTPQSKSKRPEEVDVGLHGSKYITIWKKGKQTRLYEFHFFRGGDMQGTWEQARQIKNKGLAKRSWMWGLRDLSTAAENSKPISGVSTLKTILGEKSCGYILTDRLSYLMKVLASGWEQSVVMSAGNKIMAQARLKLERQWMREITRARRGGSAVGKTLGAYFVRA